MTLIQYEPWNLLNKSPKEPAQFQDSMYQEEIVAPEKSAPAVYSKEENDNITVLGEIADVQKTILIKQPVSILKLKDEKQSVGLVLIERLRTKML